MQDTPIATLDSLAAACSPVVDNAAVLIDHLVGGRWREAALLASDTVFACSDGAIGLVQGLLPALGL